MARALLVLTLTLAALGCARTVAPRAPTPDATLQAYNAAIAAGDAAALHGLLDEETRLQVSEEDLAALLEQNATELQERAAQIRTERVETRAVVELPTGEAAVLSLEGDAWKIDGGVLGAPALVTPEDAIRSLRRALIRRGLRDVLSVFARSLRGEVEAEVRRFLEETADELDYETEIQGNAAIVRTSGGRIVRLTREAGEWRIVDFE